VNAHVAALVRNGHWELTRLRRSRRIWLLLIPAAAGPVGSTVADLYLRVPSAGTAQVLGLLITTGLAALVILDLVALAVGEDLALRSHYLTFALPQPRVSALAGRIGVVLAGSLASYTVGALAVLALAAALVPTATGASPPILSPTHLAIGSAALLVFLGGVTAAAASVTRSASQALVAGVLAGVVVAGLASLFLLQGRLTEWFPLALTVGAIAGFGWSLGEYARIDS